MPDPDERKAAPSPQALIPGDDRSEEKAKFASEAYNAVARSAKLRTIMLRRSKFEMKPSFLNKKTMGKADLRYGAIVKNIVFNDENGLASCEWEWSVTGLRERKKALSIEAAYVVLYDNLTGCESAAVERFLRRVARFATYPYFRAHVSQLSWESGANLPILPTIAT